MPAIVRDASGKKRKTSGSLLSVGGDEQDFLEAGVGA
jgi:hypothetical protein